MRGQGQSGQAIKLFQITLYVNNPSFKSNNVTFLGCQNISYSNPSYIFSEGSSTEDPNPQYLRPRLMVTSLSKDIPLVNFV